MTATLETPRNRIGELVPYFLRLGLLGFGGPVALVGQCSSPRRSFSGIAPIAMSRDSSKGPTPRRSAPFWVRACCWAALPSVTVSRFSLALRPWPSCFDGK